MSLRQKLFPSWREFYQQKRKEENFDDFKSYANNFYCKWALSLVATFALVGTPVGLIGNSITYSNGNRVGVINKVSEKGVIWKTKEGQLSLEGRTSTGDYTGAGIWNFSIERSTSKEDQLFFNANNHMIAGTRVKITYEKPLIPLPWKSETDYLVRKIEPLNYK